MAGLHTQYASVLEAIETSWKSSTVLEARSNEDLKLIGGLQDLTGRFNKAEAIAR